MNNVTMKTINEHLMNCVNYKIKYIWFLVVSKTVTICHYIWFYKSFIVFNDQLNLKISFNVHAVSVTPLRLPFIIPPSECYVIYVCCMIFLESPVSVQQEGVLHCSDDLYRSRSSKIGEMDQHHFQHLY